jgi:hypothetical protein
MERAYHYLCGRRSPNPHSHEILTSNVAAPPNTVRIAEAFERSFSSPTPFSDVDVFTLWTVVGMMAAVLVPVLGGLISHLRIGAALIAGVTVIFISDVVEAVKQLGPGSGAEEELPGIAGPGVAVSAEISMNAGLILRLMGVGLLTMLVIVVAVLAREESAPAPTN